MGMGAEANGQLDGSGAGGLEAIALDLDWFNRADALFWLAQPGKTGVWLNLDGVFAQDRNGPWLEKELAGWGIPIYAKMLVVEQGVLLALIVVAKRHADRVRRWLSKHKILVQ